MKKIIKIFFTIMVISLLAMSVCAAEWITKDVVSALDEAPEWYNEDDAVELEAWNSGDTNANTGNQAGYLSDYVFLKDRGLGDFEAYFEVEENGTYNIGFVLMAWCKSVPRSTTFSIDGAEPIYVCYDYNDEDQYSEQFLTGPSIYLEKGEHTITLALASDFDDSTVKSLYFDKFFFALSDGSTEAAAADTAAADTDDAIATAREATVKPKIDGVIDPIWDDADRMYAINLGGSTEGLDNPYIGNSYASLMWDADGLYLLGVMYDTTIPETDADARNSIDFWVSEMYTYDTSFDYDDGDWHYCKASTGEEVYYCGNKTVYDEATTAVNVYSDHFVVEIFCPWQNADFTPAIGTIIGFTVSFNDDIDLDGIRDLYAYGETTDISHSYWSQTLALPEIEFVAGPEVMTDDLAADSAEPAATDGFVTYAEYPEDLITGTELLWAAGGEEYMAGYDEKGGIGVDLFNLTTGGATYCLKRDASVWYEFEVSEKTDVTFFIGYIARTGSNRGLDWAIDDADGTNRVYMDLVEGDEMQWVSTTFTVEAGKHNFYIYAPTGMDDSTLKSCDVYTVELYGTPAAEETAVEVVEEPVVVEDEPAPVEEEPAAPAEEPEEPAAEPEVEEVEVVESPAATAPQTFDFGVIAAVSALVSLAGYAITKKR